MENFLLFLTFINVDVKLTYPRIKIIFGNIVIEERKKKKIINNNLS